MSTPKINFFIFLYAGLNTGRKPPGTAELPGALRTIVRVSSPGADRARDSAGREEMLPGKIRGAGNELPGCPDPSPLQRPDPEQLFPMPRLEKSRSRKQLFLRRVRVAHPAARWYNNPNNSSA